MSGGFNIGRIFGIQLKLHYSWFLIFILLVFLLVYPNWSSGVWWAVGVGASLLFFGSVVAHEVAHSLVARANGIPAKSITLFMFGGVSSLSREAKKPIAELKMAVAGPLCSLAIGGIFSLILYLNPAMSQPVSRMVYWLAFMNFALAAFNMIPGFPLDGGRVFRALVWRSTGDFHRATRIATRVGVGVGYGFIGGGIAIVVLSLFGEPPFGLSWFSGFWMAFIGWFLRNAAIASRRHTQWRQLLKRFTASQVMTSNCPTVLPGISISQLVQGYVIPARCQLFMVASGDDIQGIFSLKSLKSIPRQQWDTTPVREIVTPLDKLRSVSPEQDALSVLEEMDESGMNQVAVVGEGKVIGLVSRDDMISIVRTRSELGV